MGNTAIDTGKLEQDGVKYEVMLFGNLPFEVEDVKFTVDNTNLIGVADNDTMGSAIVSFLSYCSSLPYEGATPEEAMNWVRSAVKKVTSDNPIEKEFGGVCYALYGNYPFIITLEMKTTSILMDNSGTEQSQPN